MNILPTPMSQLILLSINRMRFSVSSTKPYLNNKPILLIWTQLWLNLKLFLIAIYLHLTNFLIYPFHISLCPLLSLLLYLHTSFIIVKYLKNSPAIELLFHASSSQILTSFTDFDWGSCQQTRRSTTGFCYYFGTSIISMLYPGPHPR